MNFPLYDSLSVDIPDKDLTTAQKSSFLLRIKDLTPEGKELFVVLVKVHYINVEKDYISLPYNCIVSKEGVSFDLEVFPVKLKQILYKFLKIHAKKMKEDISIETEKQNVKGIRRSRDKKTSGETVPNSTQ